MKFKNYLESISNVSLYPIITLLIFFIVFTVLFVWVFRVRTKEQMAAVGRIPLESGEINPDQHNLLP